MIDLGPGSLSIILCFLFLAYASWLDRKVGSVPNKLWVIACITCCTVSIYNFIVYDPIRVFVTTAFSFAVAFSLSVALFKVGLFGGADAKGLIIMSWYIPTTVPLFPSSSFPLLTPLVATVNFIVYLTLVFSMNFTRNFCSQLIGNKGLLTSPIPWLRRFSLLFAFKKLPLNVQICSEMFHLFSVNSNVPSSIIIIEGTQAGNRWIQDGESCDVLPARHIAEAWIPLRIPVTLLLSLSLFTCLLAGNLLSLIMR